MESGGFLSKLAMALLTWPLIIVLAPIGAVILMLIWPFVAFDEQS